jgi:RNase P subunit RPR2
MSLENLIEAFEPMAKISMESSLWVKTLRKHYIKTISEISGKTEVEIIDELNVIYEQVKAETKKEFEKPK